MDFLSVPAASGGSMSVKLVGVDACLDGTGARPYNFRVLKLQGAGCKSGVS